MGPRGCGCLARWTNLSGKPSRSVHVLASEIGKQRSHRDRLVRLTRVASRVAGMTKLL